MGSNRGRRGSIGQTNVWVALVVAVLALVIAIVAWTRADPTVAADVDARVAEVRQEANQQIEALRAELEELRLQIADQLEGNDEDEDNQDEDEDDEDEDDEGDDAGA